MIAFNVPTAVSNTDAAATSAFSRMACSLLGENAAWDHSKSSCKLVARNQCFAETVGELPDYDWLN